MNHYEIIRSHRRTVALEITRTGQVLVRAPLRLPQRDIAAFVAEHTAWIDTHLERQRLRQLSAPPSPTPAEIRALKEQALAVLPQKVAAYGRRMGLSPTGVKITSARTRYGSCSDKNALCFSCFLMLSPESAIDLVVVHELAHIRYKNHGPAFYALLGSILPDYQARKKLLARIP